MGGRCLCLIAMTNQAHRDDRSFYTPATSIVSDAPGRIERFLTSLYRVHRLRGGVFARSE